MPKEGYTAVTISEDVMKQAQDFILKVNKEAGYKKIRNVSHFVEEAMINFAAGQAANENSEDVIGKVVKAVFEREDLLALVCRHFLEMDPEQGRAKLHKIFGKKEIQRFRKLLGGE